MVEVARSAQGSIRLVSVRTEVPGTFPHITDYSIYPTWLVDLWDGQRRTSFAQNSDHVRVLIQPYVGVDHTESTSRMVMICPQVRVYLGDPWPPYVDLRLEISARFAASQPGRVHWSVDDARLLRPHTLPAGMQAVVMCPLGGTESSLSSTPILSPLARDSEPPLPVPLFIVDQDHCLDPHVYCTVNEAIAEANSRPGTARGYVVLIRQSRNPYIEDTIVLAPRSTEEFVVALFTAASDDSPVLVVKPTTPKKGLLEINNRDHVRCTDMKVTIRDLTLLGRGKRTIDVKASHDDPNKTMNTGLFIHNNVIFAGLQDEDGEWLNAGFGLYIGKDWQTDPPPRPDELIKQSIKWGEITNNRISTYLDAITAWVFVGRVAGNLLSSRGNEGFHLSFANFHNGNGEVIPEAYQQITVEHNRFDCNDQNGFHLAHGSHGAIRNNIQ